MATAPAPLLPQNIIDEVRRRVAAGESAEKILAAVRPQVREFRALSREFAARFPKPQEPQPEPLPAAPVTPDLAVREVQLPGGGVTQIPEEQRAVAARAAAVKERAPQITPPRSIGEQAVRMAQHPGQTLADAIHGITGIAVTADQQPSLDNFLTLATSLVYGLGAAAGAVEKAAVLRASYSDLPEVLQRSPFAARVFKGLTSPKMAARIGGATGSALPFAEMASAEAGKEGASPAEQTAVFVETMGGMYVLEGAALVAGKVATPAARGLVRLVEDKVGAFYDFLGRQVKKLNRPLTDLEKQQAARIAGRIAYDTLDRNASREFMQAFRDNLNNGMTRILRENQSVGQPLNYAGAFLSGVVPDEKALGAAVDELVGKINGQFKAEVAVERGTTEAKAAAQRQAQRVTAAAQQRLEETAGGTIVPATTTALPATPEVAAEFTRQRRLALLKERAAAIKAPARTETQIVDAARPKSEDLLDMDDTLFSDALDSLGIPGGKPPKPMRPLTTEQPPSAGLSLADVRAAARTHDLDLAVIDNGIEKGLRELSYEVRDGAGAPLARTSSLQDALAEVKRRTVIKPLVLGANVSANVLLADDPDDSDAERKLKTALRLAVNGGTFLALAPLARPSNRPAGQWRLFMREVLSPFNDGLQRDLVASGPFSRQVAAWRDVKNGLYEFLYSFRSRDELIRNWPQSLHEPFKAYLRSTRAMADEWTRWNRYLRNDLPRAFDSLVGTPGPGRQQAFDLIDGISSERVRAIADSTNRTAWQDALAKSRKVDGGITEKNAVRAAAAIRESTPHTLRKTQEIVRVLADFRAREEAVTKARLEATDTLLKPYAVKNAEGAFVTRARTQASAEQMVARAAKRGETGWTFAHEPTALSAEIEARVGKRISAYAPHQMYNSLQDDLDVQGLLQTAPWADPMVLLDELRRLNTIPGREGRRAAYEEVFGPLEQDEFEALRRATLVTLGSAKSVTDRKIATAVPRELFVRFYQKRVANDPTYQRDIVQALGAYIPPVLRDLHLGPHLPKLRDAMQAARVEIARNPGGYVNEFGLAEIAKGIDFDLGRAQMYSRPLARATSRIVTMAYSAALFARLRPATSNIIGQVFLVGIPEVGADSAAAAALAMVDPRVWNALISHDLIRNSLPFGERTLPDAIKIVRNAHTPREALGGLKDAGVSVFDFMAASEIGIRSWALLAGFAEEMKARGMIRGPVPGVGFEGILQGGTAVGYNKHLTAFIDAAPDDVMRSAMNRAEETVRKVAFFFDRPSLPRAIRSVQQLPFGGPFTQFSNFPVNYANRFVSIAHDAFDRRLAPEVRAAAQGKIIRHLTMTLLIAGPMGLPVVNEAVRLTSEIDPDTGARLRHFLQPYQSFWAGIVGQRWASRDLSKFSTLQPIWDFVDPQRFPVLPVVRLGVHAAQIAPTAAGAAGRKLGRAFGLDIPIEPAVDEESRRDLQRWYGALTPYFTDDPAPETSKVPEAIATLMAGGGAWQDWWNFLIQTRHLESGVPGPLDPEHRLRTLDPDPAMGMVIGRSVAEREALKNRQYLAKQEKISQRIVNDFLAATFDPNTKPREFARAQQAFLDHPMLALRISGDDIARVARQASYTDQERTLLGAPRDVLLGLAAKGMPGLLTDGIEQMDPGEAQRRQRLAFVFQMALAQSARKPQ